MRRRSRSCSCHCFHAPDRPIYTPPNNYVGDAIGTQGKQGLLGRGELILIGESFIPDNTKPSPEWRNRSKLAIAKLENLIIFKLLIKKTK